MKIRCSSLPSYDDCPRRTIAKSYRQMVLDAGYELRELPAGVGAAVGTGAHLGSIALTDSVISGQILTRSQAVEIAIGGFRDEIRDGVTWDPTTGSKTDAESQLQSLVGCFEAQILPSLRPTETEIYRSAAISGEWSLTGHSDLETVEQCLDDLKFGGKCGSYHSQLGGYNLLRRSHTMPADKLRIHHIPRTAVKKTQPAARTIEYPIALCEMAAMSTIKRIQRDVGVFQKTGNVWAFSCNPMSMMCGDKYCPAWGTRFCEMGKGVG